jgi:hypothetical protein
MLLRKSSYLLARDRSGTYHIMLHFALYLHSAIRAFEKVGQKIKVLNLTILRASQFERAVQTGNENKLH